MGRFWIVTVVAVGLVALAAAFGPPPSVDSGRGSGSPEPSPCPAERTQPPPVGRRVFPEARMAHREEGISVEKFRRQEALGDDVGRLAAALKKNAPDTYAELEVHYGREFRVIVYSTGDGEETVRPHVRCTPLAGLVEVRRVEATPRSRRTAPQDLERHVAVENPVAGEEDLAHATAAQNA